ncbi:Uncharacterised protein [Citrobacter freundii]|nr:Uncharacterised protein [Citrobacter freundii]
MLTLAGNEIAIPSGGSAGVVLSPPSFLCSLSQAGSYLNSDTILQPSCYEEILLVIFNWSDN